MESIYEYGTRCGVWRLLDVLDKVNAKATFFCCGQAVERNPVAAREITARGHEACAHGYRWLPFHGLEREREKEEIRKAVDAISRITGERPVGWNSRAPSPWTRELLIEEEFLYDSDSYDADKPYFVEIGRNRFLTIPYAVDTNDEKFWPPPMTAGFTEPTDFFAILKRTFDQLYAEGATSPRMMSVGLHLRIAGRPARAGQVVKFLDYAKRFSGVWLARRIDIARWWIQNAAPQGQAGT